MADLMQNKTRNGKTTTALYIALALAVLGFGISLYSTFHHLEVKSKGGSEAFCNINQTFDCDAVAASTFSEIFGIPLGVWGMGYFLAMLVLTGMAIFVKKTAREHVSVYGLMAVVGVLSSVVLGIVSVTQVATVCLICLGIYGVCLLQAVNVLVFRKVLPWYWDFKGLVNGGATAGIAIAVVVFAFNVMQPNVAPVGDSAIPSFSQKTYDLPVSKSPYAGAGEDYRKGNDNAPVVIQEFLDFECPHCAQMASVLDIVYKDPAYKDNLLIVFRNYPLDKSCNPSMQQELHKNACRVAILARCAGQYGKFWQYHDMALGRQSSISEKTAKDWALFVGLTEEQISSCMNSKAIVDKIRADVDLGNKVGVNSTPTVFINGRRLEGGANVMKVRAAIDGILAGLPEDRL